MQFLDAAAVSQEIAGEPVEQFRVRRAITVEAEVVRRTDQATAEMIVPDTVDQDASREWIVRAGDPLGELEAALAFRCIRCEAKIRQRRLHRGQAGGGDDFLLLLDVTAT